MSYTPDMPDSAGVFSAPVIATDAQCPLCKSAPVTVETWDSRCGGWTDYRYQCPACGHRWWVEGIDS